MSNILANPVPELTRIFTEMKDTYGDARRTTITQVAITKEEKEIEFVEPEKCVVVMTEAGTIKRIPATSFRTQKRNGFPRQYHYHRVYQATLLVCARSQKTQLWQYPNNLSK